MSEEVKTTRRRRKSKVKVEAPVEVEPKVEDTPEAPVEATEELNEDKGVVEPKVKEKITEESKKEESKKDTVITLDKDSVAYIEQTIKDAKTIEDIFNNLSESKMVSSLVNKIKTYRQRMVEKHTEVQGVNQQYYMYNIILEILNEKNYGIFNVKFRLLNKIFTIGKDGIFSGINLSRYDYHWKWGVKTHETYFKLISIITTLCDGSTRSKNIKTIDFNKGIDNLTNTAKQNLIRFYK